MDYSTPAFPVLHYLMEFAQIHVHWVNVKVKESEVAQSCLTLCDPVDCSLPGSSLRGILQARILEWVAISFSRGSSHPTDRTQVSIPGRRFNLWVTREAAESVMPSKHLILCCPFLLLPSLLPSIRVFSMSQLFASGGQRIAASASVLPMHIQDWFPLGLTGWISLQSKGLSRVFSNTIVQKHQFFGDHPLWSNSHICTWLLEKPQFWLYGPLLAKWCLCFSIR